MTLRAIIAALAVASGPAAAQQYEPGKGCDGFLTVQMKGCYVTNFWTCIEAPEGYVYRGSHDEDGPRVGGVFDAERNWLDTRFSDGWRERLIYPPRDPISITELTEHGTDSFDFETITNSASEDLEVIRTRIRGIDVLTGTTTTIDGVELQELFHLLTYTDSSGQLYAKGWGQQFYSPKFKVFLTGNDFWDDGTSIEEFDNSPVEFVLPGEEGFGSTVPKYDCASGPVADSDAPPPRIDDVFGTPPSPGDDDLLPPPMNSEGVPKKSEDGAKTK